MVWWGLLFFLISLLPSFVLGAELIQLPGQVLIRSLEKWEGSSFLEATTAQGTQSAVDQKGRAELRLSQEDLCSSKEVFYRTSIDSISLNHLCILPQADSISFAFIADTQDSHEFHHKTGQMILELLDKNPDLRFVLNAGDLVEEGTFSEWKKYRSIASQYTAHLPLIPVVGNHEYWKDSHLNHRDWVYGTPETQDHYYQLDFGPMVLIVLNSNIDQLSEEQQARQTSWLEMTLKKLMGKKPILVTYHHPTFSSGWTNLPFLPQMKYIRSHWLPLFQQYGVNLVLNGHEHLYERLLVNGLLHLVAGPGGGQPSQAWPLGNDQYSQFMMPGIRTVSWIKVEKSGKILIKTYDSETRRLVDQYLHHGAE